MKKEKKPLTRRQNDEISRRRKTHPGMTPHEIWHAALAWDRLTSDRAVAGWEDAYHRAKRESCGLWMERMKRLAETDPKYQT